MVLASVSGGAGTEVYIQRILVRVEGGNEMLQVVGTTAIRELNNDHAQYQVLQARCVANRVIELTASYEHDTTDVKHRIRIVPGGNGAYTIERATAKRSNGSM